MKIYTLLQTCTDTVMPAVGVWKSMEGAIKIARSDIAANHNVIKEEETTEHEWSAMHVDEDGVEYWSEVKEHEI